MNTDRILKTVEAVVQCEHGNYAVHTISPDSTQTLARRCNGGSYVELHLMSDADGKQLWWESEHVKLDTHIQARRTG